MSVGGLPMVSAVWRRRRRSLARLLRTRYPPFLLGLPRRSPWAPVFVYHEVEAAAFEADLRFLAENGYRTLGADEFLACAGRAAKSVLLTFDDARRNFWEVAFRLLREFGARATVFPPTYWIEPGAGAGEAEERPGASGNFMTWDQLGECARSGLVDVQAHGHRHALVHVSTELIGFADPELTARHHIYDWPMRREGGRDRLGVPPLGTPVYAAEPLLSSRFRLLENEAAAEACRGLVAAGGGAAFFLREDARALLRRTFAEASHRGRARRADPAAFDALLREEFECSRGSIQRRLGRPPELFAYPWMLGSDLSLRYAAEAGFKAVFGVGFDFGRARRVAPPPLAFGRLKGGWLRLLPGRGRRRLREVLPERVRSPGWAHLAH